MSKKAKTKEHSTPPRAVLITGAAGYVGSLVTRALAEEPEGTFRQIVATDIRVPADEDQLPGVTYLKMDVRSDELGDKIAEHRIDTVVHLAAVVSPKPDDTREFLHSVEVLGTENVLQACVEHGVSQIVITSSGAAYGYHPDNASYLDESCPVRGNEVFAYAHHKRLVEEMLARYREEHPDLKQLIFRVGTILGASVGNQITALFEKRFILGLAGVSTPFVFIWDGDVVASIKKGVLEDKAGIYNLAGDGAMTLREIAGRLNKPYVTLPAAWVTSALSLLKQLNVTRYGPEQVGFLLHRPVLNNARLKREFGFRPSCSSRQAFEIYRQSRASA